MLKTDQLWDKMRAQAEAEGASEILSYMQNVELKLKSDIAVQQARFDSYLPKRPADEPHDAKCQITRWGANQCCTCESNIIRRREQVKNAAEAGDYDFRDTLGSMESHMFDVLVKVSRDRK
jgi:hypothetical protein